MSSSVLAGLLFLINTLFDLYLFVLAIRMILAYAGANYFDPLTQFIIKLTNPIIKPLRKLIPNFKGIEISTLIVMILLTMIKFFLVLIISYRMPNILGVIILTIGDILRIFLNVFFYAILLQVILSWLQPYSPANRILDQITAPILKPFQRAIPPISGFDISPLFALILLQLFIIILASPLLAFGMRVALS